MIFKRVPTVYLGGFNRGRVQVGICMSKKKDVALMRFCKCKNSGKYTLGDDISPDDIGEPFVDIAFLDKEDMRVMAIQLMRAYSAMNGGSVEV